SLNRPRFPKRIDETGAAGSYSHGESDPQRCRVMANTQLGAVLQHVRHLAAAPSVTGPIDRQLLHAFSAHRDEAAFTALVRRHGPLVLGVCRSVLGHLEDAEDAFQATFVVLARKAASIHKSESLVSWLHGVAYRMALQVKRNAARRRTHEKRVK